MDLHPVSVADPTTTRRYSELDAIRGFACLSVVFLHFRDMWLPGDESVLPPAQHRALTLLRPFYGGHEAVILFFLLSGFVLALPYIRKREQAYPVYLARRVLRIYGPYLGALALSVLAAALLHNRPPHGDWDLPHWSQAVHLRIVLAHVGFIGRYDFEQYDFVIWSLIQEMRISIIFPLLALIFLRLPSSLALLAGLAMSVLAIRIQGPAPSAVLSTSFWMTLHYTAFFIFGIVLASRLQHIERWLAGSRLKQFLLFLIAGGFYFKVRWVAFKGVSLWQLATHRASPDYAYIPILNWVALIGAAGWIVLSLQIPLLKRLLGSPPSQFLGRISYSLYLIHPLVLLGLERGFGVHSLWLEFFLYVPGAVLAGWLFCKVVEEPFIALGRRVGRKQQNVRLVAV